MKKITVALLVLTSMILSSCSRTSIDMHNAREHAVVLMGTSTSSVATIYRQWFAQLAVKENINADIKVIEADEVIRDLASDKVNFSGTDVWPSTEKSQKARRGTLAFPVTARSIAVAYNNSGCSLQLTRDQLVAIFLGKIADFAQLGCNKQAITVLHFKSPSGTTAAFTETLSAFSSTWRDGPGSGLQVNWPIGSPVEGSDAMIEKLQQTPGSLGYVEADLVSSPVRSAAIASRSGRFLHPTSTDSARALSTMKLDQRLLGHNPDPSVGYPIVSLAWVVIPSQLDAARASALRRSIIYMLSQAGQDDAERLGYIRPTDVILMKSRQQVDKVQATVDLMP